MYKIDDAVIYEGSGVCIISDIRVERIGKIKQQYYVLEPIYDTYKTKIYVPVGSEDGKFKQIISPQEIPALIEQALESEPVWVSDNKEREQFFISIIKGGDRVKLIKMVHELHIKQYERQQKGLRLHASDEQILKRAKAIIDGEFAFALGITVGEVHPYITNLIRE